MVRQFLVIFFVLVFLPFFALTLVLQSVYAQRATVEIAKNVGAVYEQLIFLLEEEIQEKSYLLSKIGHDTELLQLIADYEAAGSNKQSLYHLQNTISSRLQTYIAYNEEIESVNFLYPREGYFQQTGTFINEFSMPRTSDKAIRRKPAYAAALGNIRNVAIENGLAGNRTDAPLPYLTIYFAPGRHAGSNAVEVIQMTSELNILSSTPSDRFPKLHNSLFIRDDSGTTIYTAGGENPEYEELLSPETRPFRKRVQLQRGSIYIVDGPRGQLLCTAFLIPKTGWTFYWISELTPLAGDLSFQLIVFRAAILLTLLLFLLFLAIQYRKIIAPIQELIHTMDRIGDDGHLSVSLETSGPPEIRSLYSSFESMVQSVDDLTQQKIEAELDALQFQINPHFLANTLNSIRLMAMIDKNESIKSMTESLMKITTSAVSRADKFSRLSAQIENIRHYMNIMNIRYGNRIEVLYDIPQKLTSCRVLKMINQPLVENSIVHGLRELQGDKRITVAARSVDEGMLEISVTDNGSGMTAATIAGIYASDQTPQSSSHGIGLANVLARIRLHHGAQYGMTIVSTPGEKTIVTLRLPLIYEDSDA